MYYDRKHADPRVSKITTFDKVWCLNNILTFLQVLEVGAQVLLRNSQRDTKKGDKMKVRWLGPYTVHESLGKGVYRLKNRHGTVLKAGINICRLKLYLTNEV